MITLKDLSFAYDKQVVLQNISQTINKGDFVALVGSNGTGKSTLIKLILKIKTGYLGNISIMGTNIQDGFNYSNIGYVSQKSASFNSSFPATVLEIVVGGKGNKQKGMQALKKVGLEEMANSLIGNLSGGQQQRVFIARALFSDPQILILDEPTVGIDVENATAICALLNKLNKQEGKTILMTTHNLPYIQEYINKVLFLDKCGHSTMYISKDMTSEDICNIYDHPIQIHNIEHNHKHCDCN